MGLSFNDFVKNSTELTNLNLSDEFYVQSDGIDSKITFQNLAGNLNIISVTYGELLDLISTNSLIPGQQYEISNYRTTYYMPNTNPPELIACDVEPLIITANSNNTLYPIVKSLTNPKDIIFYNYINDQSIVTGSTRGYIYRRIDTERSNDVGFDFKNVKFRRWKFNVEASYSNAVTYSRGHVVYKDASAGEIWVSATGSNVNNALTVKTRWISPSFVADAYFLTSSYYSHLPTKWEGAGIILSASSANYKDYYVFSSEIGGNIIFNTGSRNTVISAPTSGDLIAKFNSVFLKDTYNVVINGTYWNNTNTWFTENSVFTGYFEANIFRRIVWSTLKSLISRNITGNMDNVTFGEEINDNIFSGNLIHSQINGYAWLNYIHECTGNNIFGMQFQNNTISTGFTRNTFLPYTFSGNNIDANFDSNLLMGQFSDNVIGTGFNNNNLKYFHRNMIGNNFRYNSANTDISTQDLSTASIVYTTYSKDIVKNQLGTLRVAWWNTSNTYTSSAITT